MTVVIFCLLTVILCLANTSLSQDIHTKSGKKITWHNRVSDNKAMGGLEILSQPNGADIYIDGRLAGNTPLRLEKIVIGKYEIRVKTKGYSDYRTHVEVIHGNFAVVNAILSRAHHIAWRQSRTAAIQSSLLIPGKGQVDLGYSRGWTYFFGFAAGAGYSYYQWHKNAAAQDNYNNSLAAYSMADSPESASRAYRKLMNARDDMHTHKMRYEYGVIVMGGIWALNMFDVLFIAGREPVIEGFGINIKFNPVGQIFLSSLKYPIFSCLQN